MILRLSQTLNTRTKAGTLASLPLDDNPFADWSAGLFLSGRSPYVLLSDTKSLSSAVLPGQGVTSSSASIESAWGGIRECLEAGGPKAVHERHIAPAGGSVRFARAPNRSVTGPMNDRIRHAAAWLGEGDRSPHEVSIRPNDALLSALARGAASPCGKPREAVQELPALPASRPRTWPDFPGVPACGK
jgi:Domain of unknown function (DUF6933)